MKITLVWVRGRATPQAPQHDAPPHPFDGCGAVVTEVVTAWCPTAGSVTLLNQYDIGAVESHPLRQFN